MATLLASSHEGWVWIAAENHQPPTVIYANARAHQLLGKNLLGSNLLGMSWAEFLDHCGDPLLQTTLGNWPPHPLTLILQEKHLQIQMIPIKGSVIVSLRNLSPSLAQHDAQLKQLEQAIAWEAMLKRITDRVRDSLDQNQILQQAVEELALALNASSCNAALYDLAQFTSTIYYEYARNIPASQGRVAQMNDYPEIYNQLLQAEYFQFCSVTPSPVRGRVAMLACPIFDNEGVLGDLWLVNRCDYAFPEFEIRFVQQAANQCAIALRQAKLYQAAQAQVKELEALNRLKDEFLSTVSHELRTPMSNMRMAIRMLDIATEQIPKEDHPTAWQRIEHYLVILRKECEREIQLINDLLDLQRLEAQAQAVVWEWIDLQQWLPPRVEGFYDRIASREQSLGIALSPALPSLCIDVNSLDRIVAELLNNACKYTPPGGHIQVKAYAQPTELWLEIHNSGVEIPPSEQTKIFEKFYRIASNDPWKQGGTGLGLALVKGMVERLQGKIEVQSGHQQTCFTVKFQLQPTLE
jgi:signal transduction histidine kinase